MSKEFKEMAEILLKASENFYATKCDKECADYEALILHEAGYRKQEPKNIIPVGKGCDIHCGTLEQYDNFLREITKDAIKGFVEKLKALPNRDVVHSYQLGCLVISDADIDKLANEYNKPTAKVKGVTGRNELAYLVANAIVSDKTAQETAEYILEKGYRKQSDTIKELAEKIVEDLEKAIESNMKGSSEAMKNCELETYNYCLGKREACFGIINFIENLKKEYGVE